MEAAKSNLEAAIEMYASAKSQLDVSLRRN